MKKTRKTHYDVHRDKLLADPEFKKSYQELKPVYGLIRDIVAYRIEQGITQMELAQLVGTRQSSISRFETAMKMPSLSFLNQITRALNLECEFRVFPK